MHSIEVIEVIFSLLFLVIAFCNGEIFPDVDMLSSLLCG